MDKVKSGKKSLTYKFFIVTAFAGFLLFFSAFKLDYFELNKQLDIFAKLYKEINLYYVDETEPAKLMEDAIENMLQNLDPYTVYIPESRVEDFMVQTTGKYGGIGSTIRKIGEHVVIAGPYEGSPADKSGLIAGDKIISIDEKNVVGKNTEDISKLLKGTPGTSVSVTIERYGETLEKTLTREEIKVKSVPFYGMITENIGYITLNSFTSSASREVGKALQDLKENHALKGLIFDLRGNPGGLLGEAVNVSNLFIPKGQEVVSTRGKSEEMNNVYETNRKPFAPDLPLVVLINSGSASASEIVSGTMQDLDRGVIVGSRSYGKGLVQQSRKLSYGSQVKITIAKYYTPSGRCIQAINYAERNEDGSVNKVPDSLRTAFETKNGRVVYDGGGIDPDVQVSPEKVSMVLISLVRNNHIFNYATQYVQNHPEIKTPGEFKLTSQDFESFVNYLEDKDYHYQTQTEKVLEKLISSAEKEQYKAFAKSMAEMQGTFKSHKEDDLHKYENQILDYLSEEIASRYFYDSGRIRQSLEADSTILKSIEILNDPQGYAAILRGA